MPPVETEFLPLAQEMRDPFFFTVWPQRRAARDGVTRRSVEKFVAALKAKASEVVSNKDSLPMYGAFLTHNNHRHGTKLSVVTGLGFDGDRGENAAPLLKELERLGVANVFYETHSHCYKCDHNPDGLRCWRIVVFLSRWLLAEECGQYSTWSPYKYIWGHVGAALWSLGKLDPSTLDPSTSDPVRGWYPGARPIEEISPRRVMYCPGQPLDTDALLALVPQDARGLRTRRLESLPPLENPLPDSANETIARHLAPAWEAIAGQGIRHAATLALGRILRLGQVTRENTEAIVQRMALLAADQDEIEFSGRSRSAVDGWDNEDGFRWTWLKENAPELRDALNTCRLLKFRLKPALAEDLEYPEDYEPQDVTAADARLSRVLSAAVPGDVTCVSCSPNLDLRERLVKLTVERVHAGKRTVVLARSYRDVWDIADRVRAAGERVKVLLAITALDRNGLPMCQQYKKARELSQAGLDARKLLCLECPDQSNLEDTDPTGNVPQCQTYVGKTGDSRARVIVATHGLCAKALEKATSDTLLMIEGLPEFEAERSVSLRQTADARKAVGVVVADEVDADTLERLLAAVANFASQTRRVVRASNVFDPELAFTVVGMSSREIKLKARDVANGLTLAAAFGRAVYPVLDAIKDPTFTMEVLPVPKGTTARQLADVREVRFYGPSPRLKIPLRSTPAAMVVVTQGQGQPGALLQRITEKQVTEIDVIVGDHAPVVRVLVRMSNANKMSLVRHGGIEWRRLSGPVARALDHVRAFQGVADPKDVKVLLVTLGEIADALNLARDGKTQGVETDALRVLEVIQRWERETGAQLVDIQSHWTVSGDYSDFDAVISIADPWPDMTQAQRKADGLGVDVQQFAQQMAKDELSRVHGLLRTAERDKPGIIVHFGQMAPVEFTDIDRRIDFLGIGRPNAESVAGRGLPTREEREAAGMTQLEVADEFKVSARTVRRWEREQG